MIKKMERPKLSLQGGAQDIFRMQDLQSEILYPLWIKTTHVCTSKADWKIYVQEMQQIFPIQKSTKNPPAKSHKEP